MLLPLMFATLSDDLIQLVEGVLHCINRFFLGFCSVADFVDLIVEDINHIVIAHQCPAISLRIQFQEISGLYRCGAPITGNPQDLGAVRRARRASPIYACITSDGIDAQLLTGQQRRYSQLCVRRQLP